MLNRTADWQAEVWLPAAMHDWVNGKCPSMTASATNQIVQSARLAEGTRVNLTTPDGLAVYATGLVLRYYGVNRPIVEVACDDGHLWLAQPWHLQAIPDE